MKVLVSCPICLFSSGFTVFKGFGRSQTCSECGGTGKVSKQKFNTLKDIYGDLLNEEAKNKD